LSAMPNMVYLELDVPCQLQGLATLLMLDQMPSLQALTLRGTSAMATQYRQPG